MCVYSKQFDGTPHIVEAWVRMKEAMRWLEEMNMEREKIRFESD
jgi:hypothetical protein